MNVIKKYKNRPPFEKDNIKVFTEYKQEFRAQLELNRGEILKTTGETLELLGGAKFIQV